MLYKEKDSDSHISSWTVEGNSTLSVQLTGLGKYVLYEIQVAAFTRMGDGRPSSPPILERTLDDVPGPPVGILFPEVRSSSVRLIWQSPAQPNGIILGESLEVIFFSPRSSPGHHLLIAKGFSRKRLSHHLLHAQQCDRRHIMGPDAK